MNLITGYKGLYEQIFKRTRVFSQSDEKVFAMAGNSLLVLPGTAAHERFKSTR